jgi:stringent starvation protein B
MLPRDPKTMTRLEELVAALIEKRIARSLADVETALGRWRAGSLTPLSAHGAILRHAARCERTVERVTSAATDRPEGVVREALDCGIIEESEFAALVGAPVASVPPVGAFVDEEAPVVPDKRATIESLLDHGPVLIHVDPRRDGVQVPKKFATDTGLRLRFGYGLSPAIADFVVDQQAVRGTLSFGGVPFHCVLPWSAIYAVQIDGDSRGSVWPDDVPEDVLADAAAAAAESSELPVDSNVENGDGPDATAPKRRGGHLRLVD